MEGYSKIKSITIVNFMGYEKGTVVFDDTGILNFKGYNGAGKSAFLTGLAVCLMNLYPQKQVNYIRHGEKFFRIIVEFDDDITIVRDKYLTGQSLYEMYRGDKCIFTTKAGDKFSKVTEVPETIRNYLGLIYSEVGYLNYQVRRDPLWLVDTKGSENYASVHEILKSEEISRANALINSDRNALNDTIVRVEAQRNSIKNELDSILDVGEELLARLYERENAVQTLLGQLSLVKSISEELSSYADTRVAPEVDLIEESRLESLDSIISGISEAQNIRVFANDVDTVDYDRLKEAEKLFESVTSYNDALQSGMKFSADIERVENPDHESELMGLVKILSDYMSMGKEYKQIKANEVALIKERKSLMEEAEAEGMKFAVCENCGTLMMV